jgi:hypothetical protein
VKVMFSMLIQVSQLNCDVQRIVNKNVDTDEFTSA